MTTGRGEAAATTPRASSGQPDVFVSYHESDRSWVRGVLISALDEAELTCVDEDDFPLGQPRREAMERAIHESDRVIAVLTAAYLKSRHTNLVTLLAAEYGDATETWPLIPIRRDDAALPPRLAMLVPLDMRVEEKWEDQIARLRREFGVTQVRSRPVPRCPYPGMTPYTTADAELFFGRSEDVARMIDRLQTAPILTVIGPSGCGKSSLVFAGLFPRLASSDVAGEKPWELVTVRPGGDVYASLAAALGTTSDASPAALARLVRERTGDANLLLVIDQAEEIFTSGAPDGPGTQSSAGGGTEGPAPGAQNRFAAALGQLSELPDVRTVLTVRADFYGQLMSSPLWDVLAPTRHDLRPLQEGGLREAIVEPAEKVGVYVERGLVERLVADAAHEPGLLPFVQETMRMLWERIQRRLLTLAGYEALVIARPEYGNAVHSGLEVAMAVHADATIDALQPAQALTARRILIRLVQFGRGRANVRQQQQVEDLCSAAASNDEFEEVLEHLVASRLVTVSGEEDEPGARSVDLAHEALITGWPRFQAWLDERRGAEVARRYFVELAERWQRQVGPDGGRQRSFPSRAWGWLRGQDADRGLGAADLAEAERWLASDHAHEVGIHQPPITDLVAHSRSWHRARSRFWRSLTAFVVVLALAVAGAAGGAWWLAGVAREEAQRSTALLMAQASERPPEELDLAVLLALEAVARDPSVENLGALRTALEQSPELVRYLPPRDTPVLAVAASDDGRWLASAGEEPPIHLWEASAGSDEPVVLDGHGDEVLALAFSPDGRWLASGSRDDTVRVWDLADPAREPVVLTAADPSTLVAACRDDEAPALARDVRAVTFSPDSATLAFTGHNGLVERYRTDGWSALEALSGHVCDVMDVRYSPDGAVVATASRDDTVRLWDERTGEVQDVVGEPSPRRNDDGDIRAVAWHPDGGELAHAGNDGFVHIRELATGSSTRLGGHTERVFTLAFDTATDTLYSGSADRSIGVWSPDAGPQVPVRLLGHRGPVRDLAPTGGGGLLSGGQDGNAEIWDPARRVRLGRPLTGVDATAAAVTADGDAVVAGLVDGGLVAWDPSSGALVASSSMAIEGGAVRAVVSLGDGLYAGVTEGGSVGVWAPGSSSQLRTWDAGGIEIRSAVPLLGTEQLVTGDVAGILRWWDVPTGTLRGSLDLPGCSVVAMAVHPDGDELVATCNQGGGRRVALADGRPVGVTELRRIGTQAAAYTSSGALVTGARSGETALWEAGSLDGAPDLVVDVVTGAVRAVSVDPAVRRGASVADDLIHLWDVSGGRQFGEPWQVGVRVRDATFTADGQSFAVVADPGVHLLLDVDPASWEEAACELVGRNLSPEEWGRVVGSGSPVASCVT